MEKIRPSEAIQALSALNAASLNVLMIAETLLKNDKIDKDVKPLFEESAKSLRACFPDNIR